MPSTNLYVEVPGTYFAPILTARIKRQIDGLFYDAADKTFKAEANCTNPFVPFTPSQSPNSPFNVELIIPLNINVWTDGDYTIYCHDVSTPKSIITMIGEAYIRDGLYQTQYVATMTQIAGRVMECSMSSHKNPGTFGGWADDVTKRLADIQTTLAAFKVKLNI